ncbi:hypothetical protein NL676_008586 [Syzygium grande]|nr:hypothetical protein NL676_008586 [Syzygium grande]
MNDSTMLTIVQLINHEVSLKLIEKVKKGTKELINMPMEEKKKFWQRDGESDGFGQASVLSEGQKLDWANIFYMLTLPLLSGSLTCSPNSLFPSGQLVIGLNSHSDGDAITILLQANEMEGLQIKKDGKWVPVKPLPGAFIINVGDIVESIEHRATVNAVKERISTATSFSPRIDAEIGQTPSLITPETPAMFRRIDSDRTSERLSIKGARRQSLSRRHEGSAQ